MPTYDYICSECGERFEHFQSMTSAPLTQKSNCQWEKCNVNRVVSGGTGLIFKGSGFYLTDYKNNGNSESPSNNKKSTDKPKNKPKKQAKETTA